jgi:hypothetical protein
MRDRYENAAWLKIQIGIDDHGIFRSLDSNQVPSAPILERLGLSSREIDCHAAARDADLDAIAAEYVHQRGLRTPEEIADERAEARAVHGLDVELVNIYTGERPKA